MLFPGVRRKSTRLSLNIRGHPIRCATSVRFLGVTIDNKLLWRRAVDGIVTASVQRINALRRMAGVRWGNNPMSMLKLNAALITSRILYQLSLISPSPSQFERLEAVHRKGLRLAMGVPQAASNKKVTNEAESSAPPFGVPGLIDAAVKTGRVLRRHGASPAAQSKNWLTFQRGAEHISIFRLEIA